MTKRNNCTAKSLAHYDNLWTFELTYPRYIHGEFLTHRTFSRNASSSRAIPVKRMVEQIENNPVVPPHVYMNKPGMVGDVEADEGTTKEFNKLWLEALNNAVTVVKNMDKFGIHKQHINRILEPFQYIKVIVTATEWDNFFNLRLAPDAHPEMQDLARAIYEETHEYEDQNFGFIAGDSGDIIITVPYITEDDLDILGDDCDYLTLMKVSAARCARVSYNNHDGSKPDVEKDLDLYERLSSADHMSPLEHTCMMDDFEDSRNANLVGWVSLRYLVETMKEYDGDEDEYDEDEEVTLSRTLN